MTSAQKGRLTRKANDAARIEREAIHKRNAPVRAAWKSLRVMIRGLGALLAPSSIPERWRARNPTQREADIQEALQRVRDYTARYEQAKFDVRMAKAGLKPRAKPAPSAHPVAVAVAAVGPQAPCLECGSERCGGC